MSVLDKAKEHFKSLEVKTIEVPEWGLVGDECIYAKPFTLAEKKKLFKTTTESDVSVLADVLIMKAMDKKGEPMFTLKDKLDLMHGVDADVLSRVANEIITPSTHEEVKKK
jgi:hypothetical protein